MNPAVSRESEHDEFETDERCSILEIWNVADDPDASIARATVDPGVTTQRHYLVGVDERLLVASGSGIVDVEGVGPTPVGAGDVVVVPAETAQHVQNDTAEPLVFYCICTPRFTPECYRTVGS